LLRHFSSLAPKRIAFGPGRLDELAPAADLTWAALETMEGL
jgi:hypothetical protein